MDFEKSIFENRLLLNRPFIVAHRGVCTANVPCNSLAAYKIALDQGADVVEIDVSISKDGKFYVFHPGMEKVFLGIECYLSDLNSDEIDALKLLNQDKCPTHYHVPTLREVLLFLKDKVYINVDKFWTDIEGISRVIRECGVEKQVIVKTGGDEKTLVKIEKYASDLMYMPVLHHKDVLTDLLLKRNINVIGVETIFEKDDEEIISKEYIDEMHSKKMLLWVNSIIYDEREIISGGHTDDISLTELPEKGWGWLINQNIDFIQTDWVLMLKLYMNK